MKTILDFTQGEDKIDIQQLPNITQFSDLETIYQDGNTIVYDSSESFGIELTGQFQLTEDDFVF